MVESSVTIDLAGGRQGGAARFLAELEKHVVASGQVQLLGRSQTLTPRWLLEREYRARGRRRIAINNASFVKGEERVVLLRNALHFASEEEFQGLGFTPSRELRAQIPVIRRLTRRATEIIVPCTAMKERVVRYLPQCESQIVVRFHPVGQITRHPDRSRFRILMPIINTPYKQLDRHVSELLRALDIARLDDVVLQLTGVHQDYPYNISADPRIEFLGVLTSDELAHYWSTVGAVYFPTKLEAFGYPLAEARVHGVSVIAIDNEQTREIAGPALSGFLPDDLESLVAAIENAVGEKVQPDAHPFDPQQYFGWLVGAERP